MSYSFVRFASQDFEINMASTPVSQDLENALPVRILIRGVVSAVAGCAPVESMRLARNRFTVRVAPTIKVNLNRNRACLKCG